MHLVGVGEERTANETARVANEEEKGGGGKSAAVWD